MDAKYSLVGNFHRWQCLSNFWPYYFLIRLSGIRSKREVKKDCDKAYRPWPQKSKSGAELFRGKYQHIKQLGVH